MSWEKALPAGLLLRDLLKGVMLFKSLFYELHVQNQRRESAAVRVIKGERKSLAVGLSRIDKLLAFARF